MDWTLFWHARRLGQLPKLSFSPGATIVFRGGIYRNTNNAGIRKKLTLQPYPYEKPGSRQRIVTGWVANGTIWHKDGWTYSFPSNGQ